MSELTKLPNIGKVLHSQLLEIGVKTPEQLTKLGAKQAWLSIRAIDPSACYNRLCALEGAIKNVRWQYLSDDTKKDLKEFYETFKF